MDEFFILGTDGNPHQILIYDVIGMSYWTESVTAKNIVLALAQVDPKDEILVRINSRGGATDDGTAIYNALANHVGKVTIRVEGYACSMASVVACAGTTEAYETSLFMLHRASAYVYGNMHDMIEMASALEAADKSIAAAYARKTGKTAEDILAFLDEKRDTWLTPEDAKAFGIVDEVIVPSKFVALLDKSAATALAAGEGAAIIERKSLPPKIKAALEGVSGAVAFSIDANGIQPIKAEEKPAGGEGDGDGNQPDEPTQPAEPVEPAEPATPTTPTAGPKPAGDDPVKADRARVSAIMAQAKAAGLEDDDIVQDWIGDGTSAEAAGKFILAIKRTSQSANHVQSNSPHEAQQNSSAQAVSDGWGDAYKSVSQR